MEQVSIRPSAKITKTYEGIETTEWWLGGKRVAESILYYIHFTEDYFNWLYELEKTWNLHESLSYMLFETIGEHDIWQLHNKKAMFLFDVNVKKEERGKGIGSYITAETERRAKEKQMDALLVIIDPYEEKDATKDTAITTYCKRREKLGFQPIGSTLNHLYVKHL